MRRLAVLLLCLGAATAVSAATADAAPRRVPRGWLGVVADGPLTRPGAAMNAEWDLLAGSGAESVRTGFYWPSAQPVHGTPPDLSHVDAVVLAAARRGLGVLPIVTGTPGWAATRRGDETSPPRHPGDYGRFLAALVARYGPAGSLWAEHPDVAQRPVREWQVWNEPNLTRYWSRQPFARGYVRLLRAARRALRAADPGARVVLAGLPNRSWTALRSIYRAGGRRLFDAVALHPYTGRPSNVVRLARLARRVMRGFGDARKPIWITELSWPAALGRTRTAAGFETTDAGQARRLGEGLRRLAAARRALRIERVYWYTWLSEEGGPNAFAYSGLRRLRGGAVVSAPALRAFRAEARRLEGCAKAPGDAARCR